MRAVCNQCHQIVEIPESLQLKAMCSECKVQLLTIPDIFKIMGDANEAEAKQPGAINQVRMKEIKNSMSILQADSIKEEEVKDGDATGK